MGYLIATIALFAFFIFLIWFIIKLFKRKPKKQQAMGMLICFVMLIVGLILSPNADRNESGNVDPSLPSTGQTASNPEDGKTSVVDDELDLLSDPEQSNDSNSAQEALKESLGGSVLFYKNVQNDVTGKWRLLLYYSTENIVDHAVDYYNAYFESDDEVHIVVNLGLETTSVLNVYFGSMQIDVHEYVDKEENDAKILGSGMLLKSYTVDLSTGEAKDLSEITNDSGNSVSLSLLESAISDAIPQEYKSNNWFNVSCDAFADGGISVIAQIDQGSGDASAALQAAAQCFEISKTVVEDNGAIFETISVIVVNNGAPVGIFSTQDGKNFVSIDAGKRTEISLP